MAVTGVEEEVRAVLNQMIDAQNAGDRERLRPMLSNRPDAVFIGTDAGEWWRRLSTLVRRIVHWFDESAASSFGWLIHAAAGRAGGVGILRTNLSGCSA